MCFEETQYDFNHEFNFNTYVEYIVGVAFV